MFLKSNLRYQTNYFVGVVCVQVRRNVKLNLNKLN